MGRRQAACHLRMDTDGRAYVGGLVRLAGGSHAAPGLAVALAIDFGVDRGVKIFGAAVRVFPKGLFHDRHGIPLKENSASLNLLMNTFRFKADRIASVLIRRDAEDIDMSASAESDGVSYRIRVLRSTRCTVAVARALAMLHAERRI